MLVSLKKNIEDIESLVATGQHIIHLKNDGYFRINQENTSIPILIKIADYFGNRQGHLRADEYGIAEVSTQASCPNATIVKSKYRDQYLDMGTGEHKPHTDGTYIDGLAKDKTGRLVRVRRPKLVILQMVQKPESGGASVLVDGKRMLEDAIHQDPEIIKQLMKPHFIFCRDDQQSQLSPLFAPISPDSWSIRWRSDFAVAALETATEAFKYFYENYVKNPKYLTRFYLEVGEMVIIDNLRVLHGREAFLESQDKPRFLRRIWIADEEIHFINPIGKDNKQRSLGLYEPYCCVEADPKKPAILFDGGIHLNQEDQVIAKQLWSESILY